MACAVALLTSVGTVAGRRRWGVALKEGNGVKIAGFDVVTTAKEAFKQFREDDLQGRAAEVAYNLLFSVVPLLIFLTALSGFIARAAGTDDAMQKITTWLFDHMGTDQAQAVRDPIERVVQSSSSGLLSFGAILALWGGKNAVAAIMKALNVAYDVEESRSWPKRTGLAIGLTIALGLAVTLASAIFLAGSGIAEDVTRDIGLGETWLTVWSVLRWPVIAAILVIAVSALYWAAPNTDTSFKSLTAGSILTVVVWGIATLGLGFYFANFAGYAGGAYGALGGVLAFIFWLDLMVLILLLGAELNSVLASAADVPAPKEGAEAVASAAQAETSRTPAQSVPRGTYTPGVARAPSRSFRRSLTTVLVTAMLAVAKALLKLRPYAARLNAYARR
jgi:membrane protein